MSSDGSPEKPVPKSDLTDGAQPKKELWEPKELPPLKRSISKRLDRTLTVCFAISIALSGVLLAFYLLAFVSMFSQLSVGTIVKYGIYLGLLLVNMAGCVTLIVFDFNTHMKQARYAARITEGVLIISVVVGILISGLSPIDFLYLFQFGCLVFFELYTDQELARNKRFMAPWEKSDAADRKGYIPLNFFHIFWVFVIASIIGLLIEVIYHAIVFGGYQSRAGLLWGPFSPIYGFGAVLMTIALNRFWNKSKLVIFVVAGLIGAAFEFFTSWFMETSFGIVAWDYSGTFLNIQGRTNFAFFCAWGFLGLVWIRLILPDVLKLVDAIPIKLRAWLTVVFTVFMLFDGFMTLVTIDCWYQREAGQAPENAIEEYCAVHYDDEWMADRFATMDMDVDRASRVV